MCYLILSSFFVIWSDILVGLYVLPGDDLSKVKVCLRYYNTQQHVSKIKFLIGKQVIVSTWLDIESYLAVVCYYAIQAFPSFT